MHLSLSDIISYALIIAGNAVVLLGVLLWDWQILDILYIYWFENVLYGLFTVVRMAAAGVFIKGIGFVSLIFIVPFFIVHYGLFTFVHGVFLMAFSQSGNEAVVNFNLFDLLSYGFDTIDGFAWVVAGLCAALLVVFAKHVARDYHEKTSPREAMASPYGRIIILHLTILLGAFITLSLGQNIGFMIIFVVLKILYDIALMYRHDKKAAKGKSAHESVMVQ